MNTASSDEEKREGEKQRSGTGRIVGQMEAASAIGMEEEEDGAE